MSSERDKIISDPNGIGVAPKRKHEGTNAVKALCEAKKGEYITASTNSTKRQICIRILSQMDPYFFHRDGVKLSEEESIAKLMSWMRNLKHNSAATTTIIAKTAQEPQQGVQPQASTDNDDDEFHDANDFLLPPANSQAREFVATQPKATSTAMGLHLGDQAIIKTNQRQRDVNQQHRATNQRQLSKNQEMREKLVGALIKSLEEIDKERSEIIEEDKEIAEERKQLAEESVAAHSNLQQSKKLKGTACEIDENVDAVSEKNDAVSEKDVRQGGEGSAKRGIG